VGVLGSVWGCKAAVLVACEMGLIVVDAIDPVRAVPDVVPAGIRVVVRVVMLPALIVVVPNDAGRLVPPGPDDKLELVLLFVVVGALVGLKGVAVLAGKLLDDTRGVALDVIGFGMVEVGRVVMPPGTEVIGEVLLGPGPDVVVPAAVARGLADAVEVCVVRVGAVVGKGDVRVVPAALTVAVVATVSGGSSVTCPPTVLVALVAVAVVAVAIVPAAVVTRVAGALLDNVCDVDVDNRAAAEVLCVDVRLQMRSLVAVGGRHSNWSAAHSVTFAHTRSEVFEGGRAS
jgi:hypothetical protein